MCTGSARALGELGDPEQVVPVAVRDQDRAAAGPEPRQLEAQLRGSPLGSMTTASSAPPARAHDVAVRPDRAELVAVDDDAHRALTGALSLTARGPPSSRPTGAAATRPIRRLARARASFGPRFHGSLVKAPQASSPLRA